MARHGRASVVLELLLGLILGIAGSSDAHESSAGHADGLLSIESLAQSLGEQSLGEQSLGTDGRDESAPPAIELWLESDAKSELELDDDPSFAAMRPWTESTQGEPFRLVLGREESRRARIDPGADRSRAPPHA